MDYTTNLAEIDVDKLIKLEKLLIKVDNDLKKKQKDISKGMVVETLKKTHEIYQIVLYEIAEMLEQAKLSELRQILTKIYNGQNNILNFILKLNTNFEERILEGLLTKQKGEKRRNSITNKEKEDHETQKVARDMVTTGPPMRKPVRKTYQEKATDTGDDLRQARNQDNLAAKEAEVKALAKELDDEGRQIDEFLKNRKAEVLAVGESKAENNLKDMLKDLGKKRREANQIEDDANQMNELQNIQNLNMNNLKGSLIDGLRHMQKAAQDKAMDDVKKGNAVYRNGELVYLVHISTNTESAFELDKKEKEKARKERNQLDQKILELEKKIKDITNEAAVYKSQVQELNKKIQQDKLDQKKKDQQEIKKQNESKTLDKSDQDKIKRLLEDNIKMKLRVKTLLDNIQELEKEMNRNFERFKAFIMSANIPEDMKKLLLNQAENLLKPDFSKKLNLGDVRDLINFDSALYKDPLIKNLIGSDIISLQREVKKQEQVRQAKIKGIPGYDPNFDPSNLDPDEKIITRKVKKMVRRQNSKGEWIEEEIEVEEEVVINTKTGEEIRKRDKPQMITQSSEIKKFMEQNGGFAIGGSKITLPKRPEAKDGQEVKIGQWFEDKDGKKVRIVKGKDGEENYEYEETYIDENGKQQTRIRKVNVKKDKNGNDIIEEEIIDKDGKKKTVQKRVVKDKDGHMVTEEVTIDENGNKILRRQKVIKEADGSETIVEEIIDQYGNKTTVKRRIMKDENGNDVVIEERIDAQGNRIITKIRKNEFGQEIVEQEIIDKNGKSKKIEKQVVLDENGIPVVQETTYDEKGNKIIKNTKIIKDADGNDVTVEEIIGADGKKIIKKTKKIKNADGSETIVEEMIDENGNLIITKKRQYKDKDGNIIMEEEKYDAATGQKIITKTKKDLQGREIQEQQIVNKDGTIINLSKTITKDKDGNIVEIETKVGSDGKKIQIQRKIFKDKDGKEVKEEVITDENGNQQIIRTKVIKDKDGNDVIEQTIINADGTKIVVRKKVYRDKDGNEVIEEEKIDSNGNRIIVRTKKGANGEDIVEEIKIGADGKQTKTIRKVKKDANGNEVIEETYVGVDGKQVIRKITKDKNGNDVIEETTIGSDGKKITKITKLGVNNKQTQTDGNWGGDLTLDEMLDRLAAMGVDKSKLEQIRQQALLKMKIKESKQKKNVEQEEQQRARQIEQAQITQEQFQQRNASQESQESLETLDGEGENEQDQADKLYDKIVQNKDGAMAEVIRQVRTQLGKQGNEKITQEEFREYIEKMKQVHQKCGDNCPHLKRFYEKLGFSQKKYKRRYLRMKDTKIEAKKKLPSIQSLQKL